jgi:signal peptidase II
MNSQKARAFWPLLVVMLLTDCATKRIAEVNLVPAYIPRELFGDAVRLTLAYNPGAATGFIPFGEYSREGLTILSLLVVALLFAIFRRATATDHRIATALALVIGGALGNLIDRVRSARGVVDFIDVGLGPYRFWTFNIADVGITVGALLLGMLLWQRDRQQESAGAMEVVPSVAETATE